MKVFYSSQAFNLDSTKIDTAYIFLRDKKTNKIVQIQLEETEPDSGQFEGAFSLSLDEQVQFSPEVYVPEDESQPPKTKQIYAQIQSGGLKPKLTLFKRTRKGSVELEVYDSQKEMEDAKHAFETQALQARRLQQKNPLKDVSAESARVTSLANAQQKALAELALKAAQQNEDRARLEQLEAQKMAEREKQQAALNQAQKAENHVKADELSREALAAYNKGDYPSAETFFRKAALLEPDNHDEYYRYAVTLYRNAKYNEALVAFKLAKVSPQLSLEKAYYTGLTHYRMGELDDALKNFRYVAKAQDKMMSPSAEFYTGVILYAKERYAEAKVSFEAVTKMSEDPNLYDQVENYQDRIASAQSFQEAQEKRWTLTGVVGLMYDSNVLLSSTESVSSGAASNIADFRLLTLGDLQFRPVYNEHSEFAPHVTVNLINSSKDSAAPADPFLFDLYLPYSYRHKNWKLTVTPAYEILFMDPNNTGTKSLEEDSYFLMVDNTFTMSKDWISSYMVEYRNDDSHDVSSVGPDNLSSKQGTVRTTQTIFIDKQRKRALVPALQYIRNSALGSEKTYNRYDLGATYITPIGWSSILSVGFSYYNMNYGTSSDPHRVDNDYNYSVSFNKPVSKSWIWGVNGSYIRNASTDSDYSYNKYVIMTTATFVTRF